MRRAGASCGFYLDQLVLYVMQPDETRMHCTVFEMKRCRFKNIGAKFFPRLCFREDCVAKRTRAISTFLRIANLED